MTWMFWGENSCTVLPTSETVEKGLDTEEEMRHGDTPLSKQSSELLPFAHHYLHNAVKGFFSSGADLFVRYDVDKDQFGHSFNKCCEVK
ncbi:hypothetical protein CHARACLAT_026075 [Characodon lateralis]|uniref:Uncharacterized protein n=1 Tax=Characodon lateralis TaxID=208331 RepID=A0ABU7D1E6_9TELE|nr:hypothetical protein [Characodon lateralis]